MVEAQEAPLKIDAVSAAVASQRIVSIPRERGRISLEVPATFRHLLAQVISTTTREVTAPLRKKSMITLKKEVQHAGQNRKKNYSLRW